MCLCEPWGPGLCAKEKAVKMSPRSLCVPHYLLSQTFLY